MALIKCSECGKQISDKAKKCPHCGASNKIQSRKKDNKNILPIIICLLLAFLLIGGGIFAYQVLKDNNDTDVKTENSETPNNKEYSSFFPYPSISNKEELNKALSNGKVILFIAQSSCMYSKQFSPTVDIIRNDYNLNVYLIMLDKIDFNNIMGINNDFDNYLNSDDIGTPTLLLYDNGKLINSIVGQILLEELETKLKENNFI